MISVQQHFHLLQGVAWQTKGCTKGEHFLKIDIASLNRLFAAAGFLQKLQTYDKDNIPPEVVAKIRPYIDNPDFEPEVVKKASKAAHGLVCWVRAMEAYDRCSAPHKHRQTSHHYSLPMCSLPKKQRCSVCVCLFLCVCTHACVCKRGGREGVGCT